MSDAPENLTQAAELAAIVPAAIVAEKTKEVAHEAEHQVAAWEQHLEVWFNDLRQNLQEFDTETHNKLTAAKEDLKARLRGLIA